jgi:hypothetical protein
MSSQTDGAGTEVSFPWPARTRVSRTELDPTSFVGRTATIHPDRVAVVHGERRRRRWGGVTLILRSPNRS